MVALLKHCCCDNFIYHFSYDEVISPGFESAYILYDVVDFIPTRIISVPFYYPFASGSTPLFCYQYRNGLVLDNLNNSNAAMPFRLRVFSQTLDSVFYSQFPLSFFISCFYFCPEVIDNCVPADLELRAKIVEFVNSINVRSFAFDGFNVDMNALLSHFYTFPYKIHLKFSCDIKHIDKYFPSSQRLHSDKILEVKNVNFEVNIV